MKKVTEEFFCSVRITTRTFTLRIAVIIVLVASFFLSSCSSSMDLSNIGEAIEKSLSGLLTPSGAGFGGLRPPEGQEAHEIGSSQDLFFVLQDSLYSFSPDVYIQVEEYPMFSRYWDELTVAGALHSAFQVGQVQIEYDNRSPCTIRLNFTYNHCGNVIGEYLRSENPSFSVAEEIELYKLILEVRELCIREEMNDYEKVIAVHDYLVVHSIYTEGEDTDYLATALSILRDGQGQCQGYSEAFAAIMILSGIETRVVSGKAFDAQMNFVPHAWNQVKIDGVWYHVDVTWDDPIPDTGGDALHTYLCRSDDFLRKDHLWSEYFPECPSDNPLLG